MQDCADLEILLPQDTVMHQKGRTLLLSGKMHLVVVSASEHLLPLLQQEFAKQIDVRREVLLECGAH